MTPEQAALVERLRTLLASEQVVRETSMFGVRSFMSEREDGGQRAQGRRFAGSRRRRSE